MIQRTFPSLHAWSVGLALLAGAAGAQIPDAHVVPPASPGKAIPPGLFGAAVEDGGVVAGGPDYKAHIRDGVVRLTPALGRAVEVNQTLSFAYREVRRGDRVIAAAGPAATPRLAGTLVTLEHPGGVLERYEVLPEGLLQSFVLAERPAGSGDLVVRGRVETVLPAGVPTADGGVAFRRPGVGGVRFGAVTGIDARGATAPGSLRLDGEWLELVLPGAFVDAAAYPLVVDPLIGPEIDVDGSAFDDFDPDVASSTSTGRYLVAWMRSFSIGDNDIRATRLDGLGNPIGGLLFLESTDAPSANPAVGHVLEGRRYLVVWEVQPSLFLSFDIQGRAVDALDGALSPTITIAGTAANETRPDVGGERTLADNDAFVVWQHSGTGIVGAQVTVPLAGDPITLGAYVIADDFGTGDYTDPAISKSGGDAGRYLVAWESGSDEVHYRLVDRNGNLIGGAFLLGALLGGPHRAPACAGDGENFVLAWQRGETFAGTSHDVYALSLTYNGSVVHNAWQPVENDADDEEFDPDVVFNGAQYVVAYQDVDASGTNVYAKSIDPFTCLICESESLVSSTGSELTPAITSEYAGAFPGGDNAFLVWWDDDDVHGQLYDCPFGQKSLDGGCGEGGLASTPCPFDGNDNFTLHLREAAPLAPAFLVLAFQSAPFSCGPCTVWPSLANPHVFYAGLTDQYGNAQVQIPIPDGVSGVPFTTQWGVVAGTSCALFGVDLSNGVQTTVQL